MHWLNYHHLLYFWTVAREGSVAAACKVLRLAQPTISGQIRDLERALDQKLFDRSGRRLVMTEAGRTVFRYADEIFSLGREMVDTIAGRPVGAPLRLRVGVADVLPKLIVYKLLAPVLRIPEQVRLICREGKSADLMASLSLHDLDLVLSDSPVPPNASVRAFSHRLGESGVLMFGHPRLAALYRAGFPKSLDGAPLLYPLQGTVLRRQLDQWLDSHSIRPVMAVEFEDSALMKVFGQSGVGMFLAPAVIESDVRTQFGVRRIGRVEGVREQYYAISMERKIKHPAIVRLTDAARGKLLATPK